MCKNVLFDHVSNFKEGIQAYLYCVKMFEYPFVRKRKEELGYSRNHISWLETFQTINF